VRRLSGKAAGTKPEKKDMAKQQPEKPTTETQPKAQPSPARPAGDEKNRKYGYWWGTGRRKSAVARVRLRPGEGKLLINNRLVQDYFTQLQDKQAVAAPLKTIGEEKLFDVFVNVRGGGASGQAGAVMLGIARALKQFDESYLPPLRDAGYLTRDARVVERKKYGQSGARRRFQFSKR
jgi:small subunit ribosomal protein S9